METLLYFTIPDDDFKCLPLRNFLSTMLANVVCKPILELLSDPDFINLMVARLVSIYICKVFKTQFNYCFIAGTKGNLER